MPRRPVGCADIPPGHRPKADGNARLPKVDGAKPQRSRLKSHPIGFFHLDIAEVHTEQGRLHLSSAVDRTSKFAFAQLHERATRKIAADFLHALVAAVPYRIHTVLTDNGTQFVDRAPTNLAAKAAAEAYGPHATSRASGSSMPSTMPASSTASTSAPRSRDIPSAIG